MSSGSSTDPIVLAIARAGNRVIVVGDVRTPADREQLRELALEAITREMDIIKRLEASLANEAPPPDRVMDVVLDVRRAGYLDATALALLVTIARKCVDAGSKLVLEGANADLAQQLRVTHIDQVLTVIAKRAPSDGAMRKLAAVSSAMDKAGA